MSTESDLFGSVSAKSRTEQLDALERDFRRWLVDFAEEDIREANTLKGLRERGLQIVDAVGGKIEVIVDGGIRRGTHVLKALSLGATACSFGKGFLFALSAGGQKGVEMALQRMKDELRRDMILLGKKKISDLSKDNIAFRD